MAIGRAFARGEKHLAYELLVRCLKNEAALDSTYARGAQIARAGGVLHFSQREGGIGTSVSVTGRVKGSGGSYYSVSVDLSTDPAEVLDYSCSCPAALKYPGMCKHEIALALAYLGEARADEAPPAQRPAADPSKPAASPRHPYAPVEAPTSTAISALLGRAAGERLRESRARRARLASEPAEPARLGVELVNQELSSGADGLAIRLSIQRGRAKYVVKSVSSFVDACREHDEVVYGKNLTLVHEQSEFEPSSWALVRVLARVVDAQSALFQSRRSYRERGRGADVRALPLSDADVVDVLDALQGERIEIEPRRRSSYYHVKGDTVLVRTGDVRLACAVFPGSPAGLDVELDPSFRVLLAGGSCYLVGPDAATRASDDFAREAASVLAALDDPYGTLHVSEKDVGEFCRSVLPVLSKWCDLTAPEGLADLVPPEPGFAFRIGEDDGSVTCDATVVYGDWKCRLGSGEDLPGQPARDLAAEYHVQDVLEDYFPLGTAAGDYRFGEDDEELLFRLLTEGLPELSGIGEVLLSDRLRSVAVRPAPNLSVRATVKSHLLDVELGASGLTKDELFEYLAAFKRKQRFVRLSSGDIVRMGENLQVAQDLADGLGIDVEQLALGDAGLPSARALLIDALLDRAQGVRLERDAGFRRIVRNFDAYADADIEVPQGLHATLRSYQEDGFRWLGTLERLGFGGILADDMGLGKTVQVIAHILAQQENPGAPGVHPGPTLVVCPASLVYNWMSELARFAPGLGACAVVGAKRARAALIGSASGRDVLVTSYDLLRRDAEAWSRVHLARAVLDEAQYIKNPKAQVTRACKCLDADARFALTGTPIENRLQELWSIFDFLMPGYLGTREQFAKRYEGPVEAREHDGQRLLSCAIGPFVLRRLKSEVLADLPEKTESVVYAQMEAKQRKLYLAAQDRVALQVQHAFDPRDKSRGLGQEKLKILAELMRLRQICCDPRLAYDNYEGGSAKLDTCMELASQAVDAGHKVLIFSQFTDMLDLISERLSSAHLGHFVLTGSTSKEDRERLVKRFQAGEVPVFLISLKAGGVGLNLTAADVVIHYDPWWNTAAQDQATDRAYRIGQRRDVSVFKLIAEGTIEERILKMQEDKRGLAESVLGGEGFKSSMLTKEDLLALVGSVDDR